MKFLTTSGFKYLYLKWNSWKQVVFSVLYVQFHCIWCKAWRRIRQNMCIKAQGQNNIKGLHQPWAGSWQRKRHLPKPREGSFPAWFSDSLLRNDYFALFYFFMDATIAISTVILQKGIPNFCSYLSIFYPMYLWRVPDSNSCSLICYKSY